MPGHAVGALVGNDLGLNVLAGHALVRAKVGPSVAWGVFQADEPGGLAADHAEPVLERVGGGFWTDLYGLSHTHINAQQAAPDK